MGENDTASLEAFFLILLLSFSLALIIIGVVLMRTRLWDKNRPQSRRKRRKGPFPNAPLSAKKPSPTHTAGKLMTVVGSIMGFLSLLFLLSRLAGII